jgi:hypothetical protein
LHVSLHAREPSVVEVTVGDRVQLDRVTPSQHGYIAERHGRLLDPGTTTVALQPGHYFFKTLSDAHLRVVTGGLVASTSVETKDPPPDQPKAGEAPLPPPVRGDEVPGERPSLTIE